MRVLDRPLPRTLPPPVHGLELQNESAPTDSAAPSDASAAPGDPATWPIRGFGPRPDAHEFPADFDPHNPACFWVAPEDDMPQLILHLDSSRYQAVALTVELESRGLDWWVCEDLPCGWDRSDPTKVICPDVMVGEPPRPDGLEIYQHGKHGQLHFVAEIGSRASEGQDQGPKTARYAERLRPDEYLYFNPRNNDLRLFLWDRAQSRYEVAPTVRPAWATGPHWEEVQKWGWSAVLEFWFAAMGNGELRMFDRTGRQLETFQETFARATQETERANRAEVQAQQEAERATQADARARQEAERATQADARARQEADRAAHADARAAEAEQLARARQARLEELERRLAALEAPTVP